MQREIVDFLRTADPDMDVNPNMSLNECIEAMMDKISEMELDYSILSTAFVNGVNPARFEDFHEAVMQQYDGIAEGAEIPESILDRLAAQYR